MNRRSRDNAMQTARDIRALNPGAPYVLAHVRKGEHGVKVCTFVNRPGKADPENPDAQTAGYRIPRTTTVFHISQTDAMTRGQPSGTLGESLLAVL